MKYLFFLFLCFMIVSCATVDIDDSIKMDTGIGRQGGKKQEETPDFNYPIIEIVEKPIYVPAEESPPRRAAPGTASVNESNKAGIIRPHEYSHAAMVYTFDKDQVYEVYTQPLRVSDISLQAGEMIVEPPFVSDSERWVLGAGISYENGNAIQHVYVKPTDSGLSASLIINTDRRVYRIILRSYKETHMPVVRWKYSTGMPGNYVMPPKAAEGAGTGVVSSDGSGTGIDPRFLSFNYRITYGLFSKPNWLPKLVFDDGSKTYINFPDLVLQRELPTVFENRNDILNYRVNGNVIIIDKLIETISVKIGRSEISIIKKRS